MKNEREELLRLEQVSRSYVKNGKIVEALKPVNLKLYKAELLPYKIPSWIAGKAMKIMFAKNELTRKIMTLHNDKQDIFYCCQSVYQTGQELGIEMPILEANMKGISL